MTKGAKELITGCLVILRWNVRASEFTYFVLDASRIYIVHIMFKYVDTQCIYHLMDQTHDVVCLLLTAHDNNRKEESGDVEYDFEAIRNILPFEIERSSSIRDSIKHWNMGVQWWLVVHIYKNIPVRNKLVRGIVVMVISGFWHGVHPGWYATFLSAPFLLIAEDSMRKGVRRRLTSDTQQRIYDVIACFVTMRYFEYFAVGAFFLVYDEIWRFWSSLYFYGHISLVILILVGQLLSVGSTESTKKLHKS